MSGLNLSRERIARALRLVLTNPRTLQYLALDATWSFRSELRVPPLPLSWPLPPDKMARVEIRWPEHVPLPDAPWWEPKLRAAFAAHTRLVPARIDHPFTSVLFLEAAVDGQLHRIAIDYRDSNELTPKCANSAELYFKLQFSNDGYPHQQVVPGGYFVGQPKYYRYLTRLRALRERRETLEVYGRFGPRGEALRERVTSLLRNQEQFVYSGGLGTAIYGQYLRETAQSKVAVDLPGHGWLCYRLAEYLGLGACVVAIPHRNRLHVPLVDRKHVAYTSPDGRDVVDLCSYYLEHDEERLAMMRNALDYFDRFVDYRQLGSYYLSTILERFG